MPINCDINVKLSAGFWLLLGLTPNMSVIGWENAASLLAVC